MKKLIALLLGLAMLCGCAAAFAEDSTLPVMEAGLLVEYNRGIALTQESYPRICLSPYGAASLYESTYRDPWYVTFPCPEGALCLEFDTNSCQLFNPDTATQYLYQLRDDYSYESFLNKCDDEANILTDGSDGIASYISPKGCKFYLLVGLNEMMKGAKLCVTVYVASLYRADDAEKAAKLKEAAEAEAARLRESIAKADSFWTEGAYSSVKMASEQVKDATLTVKLGEAAFHFTDNEVQSALFPVSLHSDRLSCYAVKERGVAMNVEINVDTYSAVYYDRDESEITRATLSDGDEWGFYAGNIDDNGRPFNVYASKIVSNVDQYGSEKSVYLNIQLNPAGGLYWADMNAFQADLDALLPMIQFEVKAAE